MPTPVLIPKATLTMEAADIVAWRKQPGDAVAKDEILFEMETDKVIVEVPAPASGVLLRIEIAEGAARLDQVIGWIGEPGEAITAEAAAPEIPAAAPAPPAPAGPGHTPGTAAATPAARRRARELGIEIASVRGTGPGGRITEHDVDNATRQI
jgi:pyruvate/2-oxoglutarate dehydrogenase complex dihydrolipoamide acyltransferase (E2) component